MPGGRTATVDIALKLNLSEVIAQLNSIKAAAKNIGNDSSIGKNLENQIKSLTASAEKLQADLENVKLGKVSSAKFTSTINEINSSIYMLQARTAALESAMQSLISGMSAADGGKFSGMLDEMRASMAATVTMATQTADALKGISDAAGKNTNIRIVDTKGLSDVKKQLKDAEAIFRDAGDLDGKFKISDKTFFASSAEDRIKQYKKLADSLENYKNKLSLMEHSDEGFAETLEKATKAAKNFSSLSDAIYRNIGDNKSFGGMLLSQIDDLNIKATNAISDLRENIAAKAENVADELKTMGGKSGSGGGPTSLDIPINLSENTASIVSKVTKAINAAQKMVDAHPLELTIEFTSGFGTKRNRGLIRQFQEKVNNMTDSASKAEFQSLIDDINKGFGNALNVKINTDELDKANEKVRTIISDIKSQLNEDALKDFSIELTKVTIADDVKAALQSDLTDIGKNLEIVIDNIKLGQNANISELQTALSNIGQTITSSKLSDILFQMHEANSAMEKENTNLSRERQFYFSTKTGKIGNHFYYGETNKSTGTYKAQWDEVENNKYNAGVHTHPHTNVASMSYNGKKGDLYSYWKDEYAHQVELGIVSALRDSQIFNLKGFFDKYKSRINFDNNSTWNELSKELDKSKASFYDRNGDHDLEYLISGLGFKDKDFENLIRSYLGKFNNITSDEIENQIREINNNGPIIDQIKQSAKAAKFKNFDSIFTAFMTDVVSDDIDKKLNRKTVKKQEQWRGEVFSNLIPNYSDLGNDSFQYYLRTQMADVVEAAWGNKKGTKGIGRDLVDNFINIVPTKDLDSALGMDGISQAASDASSSVKTLGSALEEITSLLGEIKTGSGAFDGLKDIIGDSSEIKSMASSLTSLLEVIEKATGISSSASLDKMFGDLSETTKAMGKFNLRTKEGKQALQDIIDQYDKYAKAGGTKSITDLTDDKSAQKKLTNRYAQYIEEQQKAEQAALAAAAAAEKAAQSEQQEAEALGKVDSSASAAATSKKGFIVANQGVGDSAVESAGSITKEGDAMSSVAKIATQMHEANSWMGQDFDKKKSRERAFYFNSKTGSIGNPFVTGESGYVDTGLLKRIGFNASLHTHPEKVGGLSLVNYYKDKNGYAGDLITFINQLKDGIDTQVISGSDESQIIDVKGFYEKYKDRINVNDIDSLKRYKAILNDLQKPFQKEITENAIRRVTEDLSGFIDSYFVALKENDVINDSEIDKLKNGIKKQADLTSGGNIQDYLLDRFKYSRDGFEKQGKPTNFKNIFDSIFAYAASGDLGLLNITEKISKADRSIGTKLFNEQYFEEEFNRTFRDTITPMFFDAILGKGAGEDFMQNFQRVVKTSDLDKELGIEGLSSQASGLIQVSSLIENISTALSGMEGGAKGFEALNKILNNLGGKNGEAKLQATVNALKQIQEALNAPMNESGFLDALTKFAEDGEKLKDLATVLKASAKDIKTAQKAAGEETGVGAFDEADQQKDDKILENGIAKLKEYGQLLDVTLSREKDGMTGITGKLYELDKDGQKHIKEIKLLTSTGDAFSREYIKQDTADLQKYLTRMQRISEFWEQRKKQGTDDTFLRADTDADTWRELVNFASQYTDQIGEIQKVTRQVRQDHMGNLLESFTFVGDKGHVTMGREKDVVATSQTYADPQQTAAAYDNLTKSVKQYVSALMSIASGEANLADLNAVQQMDELIQKLASDTQEANDRLETMSTVAQTAQNKFNDTLSGEFDKQFDEYTKKISKQLESAEQTRSNQRNAYTEEYNLQLAAVRSNLEQINALRTQHSNGEIWDTSELQKVASLMKEIGDLMPGLKDNTKILAKTGDVDNELLKLRKMFNDNSLSGNLRAEVAGLIDQLEQVRVSANEAENGLSQLTKVQLGEVKDKVKALNSEMYETGQAGKGFWKQFSGAITSQSANFLAQYFSLQDFIRYGREIIDTVTSVDSALIELQKVSNASNDRISQSFENSAVTAQEYGATISEIIHATADWARLGYSVDESEELARVAQLYRNVGDNISQEEASQSLISTLQGFQLKTSDAESIVDKFNEVANNFAIDTLGRYAQAA